MRIQSLATTIIDIPFILPATFSTGTSEAQSFVIVNLVTEDGVTGYGEAAILGDGPYWNEETSESIKATIDRYIAPLVIGDDVLHPVRILHCLENRISGNKFAKAAVEMAILDAAGKALELPVYMLLGGLFRERLPLSWTLATGEPEAEIEQTQELWDRGHRIFKFKVGTNTVAEDTQRIRAWRNRFPDASLRIDANQGWDELSTLVAARNMAELRIDFLEQPLPKMNWAGMARLRHKIDIPLMVDESACTTTDLVELARLRAADAVSFKPAKSGGLYAALRLAAIADGAYMHGYVGCMRETGIGTAAYAHFAAAVPGVDLGCELFGPLMLRNDIVTSGVRYESGEIVVPSGNGLGVEVDMDAIEGLRRK